MTVLLVDLGNSRIKWAKLEGSVLSPSAAAVHRGEDMADVLDRGWGTQEAPALVQGASVVGAPLRAAVEDWIVRRWSCPIKWVVSQAEALGVTNGYREPARLGVDRWLALLGAWRRSQTPACVVDCGSAVTIDILDTEGRHQGGWIAPGLHMMRNALRQGTDLPIVEGEGDGELGRDTESAIRNGTLQAVRGLIEQGMLHAPASARLLITGGNAAELSQQLNRPNELCPDLVLEGLAGTLEGA
jgi:type III pantothenate kinase